MSSERLYLTAISIEAGIITLIDNNGNVVQYRQRGLNKFNENQIKKLIQYGLLNMDWKEYKELPKNISIEFEEPSIMGKAQATYPSISKIVKMLSK